MDSPWENQRKLKYRDHDIVLEDIKDLDFTIIKGTAIRNFVESRESDQVKLIIGSFMGYLTSKGYRVTKKEP